MLAAQSQVLTLLQHLLHPWNHLPKPPYILFLYLRIFMKNIIIQKDKPRVFYNSFNARDIVLWWINAFLLISIFQQFIFLLSCICTNIYVFPVIQGIITHHIAMSLGGLVSLFYHRCILDTILCQNTKLNLVFLDTSMLFHHLNAS